MLSTLLFGLLLLAVPVFNSYYPPDEPETQRTFGEQALCIETFAASFYTAMVVEHGFDVVAGIEVPGTDAAKAEYNTVLEILEQQGLCDADWVAFTASRPIAVLDTLPLAAYLEKTAHEIGQFLYQYGLLDNSTEISLAFDFLKLVSDAFDGLDENKLESYMHAVVQGLVDLIKEHGLNLDEAANNLAFLFTKQFSASNRTSCSKNKY